MKVFLLVSINQENKTKIWILLVWFYGISTIAGYLMLNLPYILDMYDLVGFYGISTIVGYLMPNPVYTY